jgi:hypothetical protein
VLILGKDSFLPSSHGLFSNKYKWVIKNHQTHKTNYHKRDSLQNPQELQTSQLLEA